MKKTATIIGARSAVARLVAESLDRRGFRVSLVDPSVGELPADDAIDLYVDATAMEVRPDPASIRTGLDHRAIEESFSTYALGPLRLLGASLGAIERGALKRVCIVTSQSASINLSQSECDYGHCMALAALHQALAISFNALRPAGISFRILCREIEARERPTSSEGDEIAAYFIRDRFADSHRSDEDRFVMRDRFGREYPW